MHFISYLQQTSLRARVLTTLLIGLSASFLLIGAFTTHLTGKQLNERLTSDARRELFVATQTITESVILGDIAATERHLKYLATQPSIAWIQYNDQLDRPLRIEGPKLVQTRPDWFARQLNVPQRVLTQTIDVGGTNYGMVSLQTTPTVNENYVWDVVWRALLAHGVVLLLTIVFIAYLLRLNLQGLNALQAMARTFEQGNFKSAPTVSLYSPPEIRETIEAFNHSAQRTTELLDEMRAMAFHDPLTGLPNRRALTTQLGKALQIAKAERSQHTFCYIDLDQFKLINDTCGHAAGDLLLSQLPKTLEAVLPANAYFVRLGGDEFGLLLLNKSIQITHVIANLLIDTIRDFDFLYEDRTYKIGASVGIAVINSESQNESEILMQADMACYTAKQLGRNRTHLYEAGQSGLRRLKDEMDWVNWFSQAIKEKRLVLFRQRIDPATHNGQPSHYEVLLRVRRSHELESPAEFLQAAERFDLAPTVDRWVMRTLCAWLSARPQDTAIYSVNLSGLSLNDEFFLDFVIDLLNQHQLDGRRIAFEITETAAIQNLAHARFFISSLKEKGFSFYLDDFGKGQASFSYLKQLPVDYLKIDGSFVLGMLRDTTDFSIVNAFNQIAHDLGCKTVGECVENALLHEKLREIGVDYVQGYAIHMPEQLPD